MVKISKAKNKEELEMLLLRQIDTSKMEPPKCGTIGYNTTVFKTYWSEDGTTVGRSNAGVYVVVPTTMPLGKAYMVDDDNNCVEIKDFKSFSDAADAIEAANDYIYKKQSFRGKDGDRDEQWMHMSSITLRELEGDITPGKVEELLEKRKAMVASEKARKKEQEARAKAAQDAEEKEWQEKSLADNNYTDIAGGVMLLTDRTDQARITLADGKKFSDYYSDPEGIMRFTTGLPAACIGDVVSSLVLRKADCTIEYSKKQEDDTVKTTSVQLRAKGLFPVVDHCPSKSNRAAYLAMKKLFGGCTSAQLFDYEGMSGIKAKVLELRSLDVTIERPGERSATVSVPINVTIVERGSPDLNVKIGSLPAKKVGYIDVKKHLTSGLHVKQSFDTPGFVFFCQELGFTKEDAYKELRKRWQLEAL